MSKKIPISVLILLHDNAGNVLLFNRLNPDGFWQSITGSLNTPSEPPFQAALRKTSFSFQAKSRIIAPIFHPPTEK